MGIQHCEPGMVVNLLHLDTRLPSETTLALVKTKQMEVIRMFLPQGKKIPVHKVSGEITVQCIAGKITFDVENESREMKAGDWLFLSGNQNHALDALEDSILLVTILLS